MNSEDVKAWLLANPDEAAQILPQLVRQIVRPVAMSRGARFVNLRGEAVGHLIGRVWCVTPTAPTDQPYRAPAENVDVGPEAARRNAHKALRAQGYVLCGEGA